MGQRVVGIIQARMGSSRLPGKSMELLTGKPLVWQFLERVKRSKRLDEIVLATTETSQDDILESLAGRCGVRVFRGSETDLVDRYYMAAKTFRADTVVRMCADNPVIEPAEIDRIIEYFSGAKVDFASNTHNILNNQYPDGLGAEVFSFARLEEIWKESSDPRRREHPHTNFYEQPERYKIGTVMCPEGFRRPELKLDVNLPEELRFLQAIYDYCYPRNPQFHITDIIRWYDEVHTREGVASRPEGS